MNVNTLEFLNRISFFSILSWSFFMVAAVSALVLTNLRSSLIRKYRSPLISVALSSLLLGVVSTGTPYFLRSLNPDQSRLTPIDQLTITQWVEPVSNPETTLQNEDETSWLKNIPYRFKYKLQFNPYEFSRLISIHESTMVIMDQKGTLRGFNAYSGLNHWSIELQSQKVLSTMQVLKKLYILDRVFSLDALRVTCIDLQNPSVLWQRFIPNSKDGELSFFPETQSVLITTGANGVWSILAKTGEVLWKRPEIYSKTMAIPSQKHVLVFEPVVANRAGAWYFIDPTTGKVVQKAPHVYPEISSFTPIAASKTASEYFLAKVNPEQFFYMKHTDLSTGWSFNASEPIHSTLIVDSEHYFAFYESKMLELRNIATNDLIWQKKMSGVLNTWMRFTPDHQYFTLPTESSDGNAGVAFYELGTGNYLFTAKTSEPIIDMVFFGDWFYLFSELHVWAFQNEARAR